LATAYPYLNVASGSIPLFLIASEACAEARNSINRLESSICPEPATTAAEKHLHELDLSWDRACEVDACRVQNFADRHDRNLRLARLV
jgi:hypothetical protein